MRIPRRLTLCLIGIGDRPVSLAAILRSAWANVADGAFVQTDTDYAARGSPDLGTIMVRYQRGSMRAFEQLHAALANEVLHFLTNLPCDASRAEELVQATFLQMHRSRHTYMPGRPVRPWALAIAEHVCRNDLRVAHRRAASASFPRSSITPR